jgi:hypothetical protein
MRNISFSATTEQIRAHQKHVTRRLKWLNLKQGDQLMGCEKVQGIKKGELVRIEPITILKVNREPLNDIIHKPFREIPRNIDREYTKFVYVPETVLEGFPQWATDANPFVKMFCEINNCEPETEVTRILFDYHGVK